MAGRGDHDTGSQGYPELQNWRRLGPLSGPPCRWTHHRCGATPGRAAGRRFEGAGPARARRPRAAGPPGAPQERRRAGGGPANMLRIISVSAAAEWGIIASSQAREGVGWWEARKGVVQRHLGAAGRRRQAATGGWVRAHWGRGASRRLQARLRRAPSTCDMGRAWRARGRARRRRAHGCGARGKELRRPEGRSGVR
jgi:hypothetical protein